MNLNKLKYIFVRIVLLFWGSTLFGQQTICLGATKNYWVDITENSGNGSTNSIYTWKVLESGFKGNISSITTSGNQVSINWGNTPIGSYTLEVTETNNGCTSLQKLSVNLTEINSVLAPEYEICSGGVPIRIDAGNNPTYVYKWTVPSGVADPGNVSFIDTNIPGNYSVSIDNGICVQNFSTQLTISSPPVINEIKENENKSIEIFATGGNMPISYSLDGINWQSSNVFTGLISGKTYTVYVKNNLGCLGDSKKFTLFFIPNVITPQSDGYNDKLVLKGIENFPNAKLQIYDRYGVLIFDTQREKTLIWEGTYLGRPLPTATYWYVLDFGDGREKKTGYILVKNRN